MKLLAFDTSTETLSIALRGGAHAPVLEHGGPGGAQASATLIPAIQALLAQAGLSLGELDAIAFGRGPGSFTGLRTATAVAQGLGFGSGVPVLPIDTLLAVAEEAHALSGATRVVAVLDARMGEVYFASYEREQGQWHVRAAPALGRPEGVQVPPGWTLAGNALEIQGMQLPADAGRVAAWPTARALLRLAPAALAEGGEHAAAGALPLYIRDKVAQTTEERAAERARKELQRGPGAATNP
ncbi:MAG TPA: tRNA (adenosine(37)-N6)-threonylcarbamoyltransferase complex dimerization subunit type 1 TsaB [Ramlibacter sp.]|nr:tRNA (adenosine(37)-N6)-threonylcarbamoyltransferase complex dimerization subunit type 1 TsaB [Ramlibacter sp.]